MESPDQTAPDFVFDLMPLTLTTYATGQNLIFEPYRKEQRRFGIGSVLRFLAFLALGGIAGLALSYFRVGAELEVYASSIGRSWYLDGFGIVLLLGAALLFGIGLGLLAVRSGGRSMMLWMMRNSRAMAEPGRIVFSPAGLTATAASGSRQFPWRTITGYRRARGHWFVFVDTVSFYWLDEDMVADPVAFASYLDRHIATATP
ncbi:MAG TPA: YcxB family protein [Beijerinckiaceae bacterium]|nr:YcxB family protein [Beijerinckiaceae bacterium]